MRPKILLIDDDEMLLITTKALLEAEGYEVATHQGAFGASAKIDRWEPDLVLLDVNMPGLSGLGLIETMRDGQRDEIDTRILLFSSNDADSLRLAVREMGVAGYICKGDSAELRERVRRALPGHSPPRPG